MRRLGAVLLLIVATRLTAGEEDRLRDWVRDLDDPRYAVRREADAALRRQSALVVPLLEKETTRNLEQKQRLERIVAELRRLPWHHDLAAAQAEAQATGKPLLLFSTLGDVYGFG